MCICIEGLLSLQIEALRERRLAEVALPLCVRDGTGWAGVGAVQGGPRVSLPCHSVLLGEEGGRRGGSAKAP